jgi:hypothetical protein
MVCGLGGCVAGGAGAASGAFAGAGTAAGCGAFTEEAAVPLSNTMATVISGGSSGGLPKGRSISNSSRMVR